MKWSLNELREAKEQPIQFAETLDLEKDLKERRNDIVTVTPIKVEGIFTVDQRGVLGSFNVKTTLELPSSRSFKVVRLPVDFDFSEYYVSDHQDDLSMFDDLDVVIILKNDVLSLDEIIEDNILLQIPIQILSTSERRASIDEMPQGNNWGVLTEEQFERKDYRKDKIDPRLAKLKDFFKQDSSANSDE